MSSPTALFVALASAMTLLVLARLLWPLWRGTRAGVLSEQGSSRPGASEQPISQQQLNATVYRDQLQELERDLARGLIDAAHYDEARDELQRRLLQDVEAVSAASSDAPARGPGRAGRWPMVVLVVCVPLASAGLYQVVGNAAAIDAANLVANNNPRAKLASLVESLKQDPNNPVTWVEVARLFRGVGRYAEAAKAFDRAGEHVGRSADLLVEHAEVIAGVANDSLEGRPIELVNRALMLEPKNPLGLMFKATHAYRQGRFDAAIADWKVLLTVLPAGSEEAANVQSNIDQATAEARLAASAKPGSAKTNPADMAPATASGAVATGRVSGLVSVAGVAAGQIKPDDTVFIIARPSDGSRAPLAVLRKRVADLPLVFTLDDSMAMVPDRTISKATAVIVSARISRSGNAMPQPGDWVSAPSAPVKPGSQDIKLVIDRNL